MNIKRISWRTTIGGMWNAYLEWMDRLVECTYPPQEEWTADQETGGGDSDEPKQIPGSTFYLYMPWYI